MFLNFRYYAPIALYVFVYTFTSLSVYILFTAINNDFILTDKEKFFKIVYIQR